MFDSQQFNNLPIPPQPRPQPANQPVNEASQEFYAQPNQPNSYPQPQVNEPQLFQASQPTPEQIAQDAESELFKHLPKPLPEETILTWRSPSRPFKKRNRQFYTTVGAIVFLISLILFFAGQMLPIAVVISVAFLYYVLSTVPPTDNEKRITNYGIHVDEELYYWEEMGRFWFEDKYGQKLLLIEIIRFPGRLTLVLGDLDQQIIEDLLKEVLIMEKPKDTFFDKSAKWLQEKIPLDAE